MTYSLAPKIDQLATSEQAFERVQHKQLYSVTELVLTKHCTDDAMIVLPMIAHLSNNSDRWLTWVINNPIDKKLLESYGINTSKLRLIHVDKKQDQKWLINESLKNGTSHCVIANSETLNSSDVKYFQDAAQEGHCHGLLINYR